MLPTAKLERALRRAPVVPFKGALCRAVHAGTLYGFRKMSGYVPRPLHDLGPPLAGARFTPKGGAPALYVAEDYDTAVRESLQLGFPVRLLPRKGWKSALVLFTIDVNLQVVLDVTDPAVRTLPGTTPAELGSAWRHRRRGGVAPTHALGRALASVGRFQALRFPSTKGTGWCLMILTAAIAAPAYVRIFDPDGRLVERLP